MKRDNKTLKAILSELRITTSEELRAYIDAHYADGNNSGPLKILKRKDLELDSEDRTYNKNVDFEYTIFDIENIQILNSESVSVKDCIFIGDLRIGNKQQNALDISINHTAVKGSFIVSGADNVSSLSLYSLSSPEVKIMNNEIDKVSIYSSSPSVFILNNCSIGNFDAFGNKFECIEISENKIGMTSFPHGQVDIYSQKAFNREDWKNRLKSKFNYLSSPISLDPDELSEKEKLKIANDTFRFLSSNSDYHLNKKERSRIEYLESLSAIDNCYKRTVYRAFGGLLYPMRIAILIVSTILLFMLIYLIPGLEFNAPCPAKETMVRALSVGEALYFSGLTFTTIGYGDITPLSVARGLAIIEGVIGVILSSSMIVTLAKRYFEK